MGHIRKIRALAKSNGWIESDHQENICMLSFSKIFENMKVRMNIYYSKMTVGTCLEHPKKGKTQLFRKYVDVETLIKLFKNPRQHTGAGYYKK